MIQVKNLDFWYKKDQPVFKNLNLSLVPGHIYGLLGKNGSGKSTLLKCMSGLSFPAHGECFINGTETSRRMVHTLEELFFLAEEVYVPALTPGQFLKNTAAFYPKFSITDFYAYLKTLDVDSEQAMNNMSYGQQKKVMIAFGLATNASVLIMDEPTNGLDIPSKVQFRKLIASVLDEERCIVISTHQVRDLDSLIDTVLILDNHQIAINSSVDLLTDKFLFGVFENTGGMNVVYEEESMRGKHAIIRNTAGQYSKMDLELLFNAVTFRSSKFTEILEEGGNNE
jgi:ABC-2 type transport system ATP-binding protein